MQIIEKSEEKVRDAEAQLPSASKPQVEQKIEKVKFAAGTQTDKQVPVQKVVQDEKLVSELKAKITSLEAQLTKAQEDAWQKNKPTTSNKRDPKLAEYEKQLKTQSQQISDLQTRLTDKDHVLNKQNLVTVQMRADQSKAKNDILTLKSDINHLKSEIET